MFDFKNAVLVLYSPDVLISALNLVTLHLTKNAIKGGEVITVRSQNRIYRAQSRFNRENIIKLSSGCSVKNL
jgi:hypothetical protein